MKNLKAQLSQSKNQNSLNSISRKINKGCGFLIIIVFLSACNSIGNKPAWVANPAAYVNPFIGTEGERSITAAANTVPGAVMPFGMLNFGPENSFSDDMAEHRRYKMVAEQNLRMPVSPGGYNYAASRVKGFSLTRLSGTGCLGASGDVPFLPFTDEITFSPDNDLLDAYYSAGYSHVNEQAKPGYYQVLLDNGVNVELAATDRSGISRFVFPKDKPARILVRTSYSQLGSGGASTKIDVEKGEITGSVTSGNFCGYLGEYNRRDYYTLYFVAKLDVPIIETGAWTDTIVYHDVTTADGSMPYGEKGIPKVGKGSGVWVKLDISENQAVNIKVGISYVSIENARLNLATEQNENDNIETVSKRGYKAWNNALLKVKVQSEDKDLLTTFYTAFYHSQFHPNVFSDVNGEYAGFDGQIHEVEKEQHNQYANFSGWDVYRSQLQLVGLVQPERGSDIAQSLLNQANQYGGVWDRWTHNSGPTGVMNGDPATVAIANFVAFGCDQFQVDKAYASLVKAATIPTEYDLSNIGAPIFTRGQKPSLDQWLKLHYISDSSNSWEGASETLEQASAYFALSQLSERLGKTENHDLFLTQSGYWKNLFNPEATAEMGYLQGRNPHGSWKADFDPTKDIFVEGSPLQYLWMVPFDGKGLFDILGGAEKASDRLDHFFHKEDGSWALYRSGGAYSDVSNQPSINAPWMYLFAGKAYKTQETLRATLDLLWNPTTTGIPGQDDLGEMSSWYVFTAIGFYPLYPGRADMVLGSPVFSNVKISRDQGDINISAKNSSTTNIYVNALKVNGQSSLNSWIPETFMKKGGDLQFIMSDTLNEKFGSINNTPPSFSINKND